MNAAALSQRERELAAIIQAYSEVTEQLRVSHERLNGEVRKLHAEIENKNRELARSERLAALGQMATGVAHEIRNPLGSIQLFASLLDRDLETLPDSQRLVRKISRGVDSLERIVGDILDFAGHREPESRPVQVARIVGGAFDGAASAAEQAGVLLAREGTWTGLNVWGDPNQLERVVLNVLLNAIDVSPRGTAVTVRAHHEAPRVIISIRDSGVGVPESVVERIFNPFFTTKATGTGLGLAIVYRIIESHGGSVRVVNEPSGGACFTLHLPTQAQETVYEEDGHGPNLRCG